jgi:hypothetical protein
VPHYYPVVIPAGRSVAGDSLGFHAYSLRIDNCTNQWYLEESSLAYIPPYSLGMCLRLYGTGVAILLAQAPIGQPQLAPIIGEQLVSVYSDQLRTEVPAAAIRQFTFVQAVSDLTEGPQPALPPVGVDRLYADPQGNIHHLHSNGTDLTLIDPSNYTSLGVAGDIYGNLGNAHVGVLYGNSLSLYDQGGTLRRFATMSAGHTWIVDAAGTDFWFMSQDQSLVLATLDNTGNFSTNGTITGKVVLASGAAGYLHTSDGSNGAVYADAGTLYLRSNGGQVLVDSGLFSAQGGLAVAGPLSLPNGSVTQPMIAAGAISQVIGNRNFTTDIWSGVSYAAGFTSPGGTINATVPDGTDLVLFNINVSVQLANPSPPTGAGWGLFIDGTLYRYGPIINVSGASTFVPWVATMLAAGGGTIPGGIAAGSHTFEVRFYASPSSTGLYLRPGSFAPFERYQFEVWVIRR